MYSSQSEEALTGTAASAWHRGRVGSSAVACVHVKRVVGSVHLGQAGPIYQRTLRKPRAQLPLGPSWLEGSPQEPA